MNSFFLYASYIGQEHLLLMLLQLEGLPSAGLASVVNASAEIDFLPAGTPLFLIHDEFRRLVGVLGVFESNHYPFCHMYVQGKSIRQNHCSRMVV